MKSLRTNTYKKNYTKMLLTRIAWAVIAEVWYTNIFQPRVTAKKEKQKYNKGLEAELKHLEPVWMGLF